MHKACRIDAAIRTAGAWAGMRRRQASWSATASLTGVLLVVALLSQAWAVTASWILPLLALAGLWLAWTDELRLGAAPDALELAIAAWLLLWLMSAATALDRAHALALSVPTLVFLLLFVLCRRGGEGVRRVTIDALAALAGLQALSLLAMPPDVSPPARVLAADSPWLLVPNDGAWWLCLWPLWWRRLTEAAPAGRWPWLVTLVAQLAALAVLQSRLVWLVLAAGCIVVWAVQRRRLHLGWLVAMAVSAAALSLLWIGKGLSSVQARLQLWQAAWSLWRSHPWLGVGPHGFGLAYRSVDVGTWVDPRQTPWPHQLVLELMANTGLLGSVAFVTMGVIAFRCVQQDDGTGRRAQAAALITFATISMLEASPLRMWWWVVLAVLLGGARPVQARTSP